MAYLTTPNLVVVIEGKRTEPKPTRHTSWMSMRDQMLRHLDCALEVCGDRLLVGFMIVEGDGGETAVEIPELWSRAIRESLSDDVLSGSLPHRNDAQRQQIVDALIGTVTWQRICQEFNLSWVDLPDLVTS